MCNDNAFGLTVLCETAKRLGLPPPASMQNDYSILNRRIEENGVSEASSPLYENVGFLAYNVLAGGILTGKYRDKPAAADDYAAGNTRRAIESFKAPRGRHDDLSWGRTLYRYRTAAALAATEEYARIAAKHGMTLPELSLRWARQRRPVTSLLLGVSSEEQLRQDLSYMRGDAPLPEELLWAVDRVHMQNRLPLFSSDRVGPDWAGRGEIGEPIP